VSLRSKIIALYVSLFLAPMLAVGLANYVQSIRSLEALVRAKLEAASGKAASEVRQDYATLRASLELLPRAGLGTSDPVQAQQALWRSLSQNFRRAEIRDTAGTLLSSFESESPASDPTCSSLVPIRAQALSQINDKPVEIVGWAPVSELLREDVLNVRFGEHGRTLVVDREAGKVIYGDGCTSGLPVALVGSDGEPVDWHTLNEGTRFTVRDGEDRIEGAAADVGELPWAIVSAASMSEFTGLYARDQKLYLVMVLFVLAVPAAAFVVLAQHFMGSLEDLTLAAERIGAGDLTPWLPPPGRDEVGRLSSAFSHMLARLKATMRQSQAAWQSAAVGGVVSQLSHEIRNPLSSIRLNLQSIEREIRQGSVPVDLEDVLGLCMREIDRLNDAVSAVLEFGQQQPAVPTACRMTDIVQDSLALIRPRLERSGIRIVEEYEANRDGIRGDPAQLRGALLNLYLNAAVVMPGGGELRVRTENPADGREVRVRVHDTGPGIRPDVRDQIFEPFFTTRANGTGLGLPVAARAVEASGGRLRLERTGNEGAGAEFVLTLPLSEPAEPEPAAADYDVPSMRRSARSAGVSGITR
jgi:signal transduction histidine kinase